MNPFTAVAGWFKGEELEPRGVKMSEESYRQLERETCEWFKGYEPKCTFQYGDGQMVPFDKMEWRGTRRKAIMFDGDEEKLVERMATNFWGTESVTTGEGATVMEFKT